MDVGLRREPLMLSGTIDIDLNGLQGLFIYINLFAERGSVEINIYRGRNLVVKDITGKIKFTETFKILYFLQMTSKNSWRNQPFKYL